MTILLKHGRIIDPKNELYATKDILLSDGKVAKIGADLTDGADEVYDAEGKIITPGLIDMHVHFREPGQEAKEDFLSGSKAAAAGGYTAVATMPNTSPVVDNAALVRQMLRRGEEIGLVRINIIGAVTKSQAGKELAEIGDMITAGAVAFSDDGHYIDSAKLMLNALDYIKPWDKIIINHDEETSLVEGGVMNEGMVSARLGLKGRPTVAEDIAVARDIMLAEYADARVHIAHISSARSVELVRQAKLRGIKVTAEATPQHLTMTEDAVDFTDSATKINPPLRTKADVQAVLTGINDGTIDMIVTDHSPHAVEEKDREYIYAPSGFPGLETSLGVLLTDLYHTGKTDLPTLIERMTYAPAKIFSLPGGNLSPGAPADVTVIDPNLSWEVKAENFYTRGSHSPFVGRTLKGKAVLTIMGGRITMRDGVVIDGRE